ncbi:hypothetical protein S245_004050 [Arachis hypogaea]
MAMMMGFDSKLAVTCIGCLAVMKGSCYSVICPLWIKFPSEEATFSNDEAFMIGNSLLVLAIYTEQAKQASLYFPGKESWYDFRIENACKGGATHKLGVTEESIHVFMRAGM